MVDASDADVDKKTRVVREVLGKLGAGEISELLVLNKVDLLPEPAEATILGRRLDTESLVSAVTGQGLDALVEAVRDQATRSHQVVSLEIPVGDGRALAAVNRVGRVLSQDYEGELCRVTVSLPVAKLAEFASYVAD